MPDASPLIGVDCLQRTCFSCESVFTDTWRRIWCPTCRKTNCVDCCSTPVTYLSRTRPYSHCRRCARAGQALLPSQDHFSMDSPASVYAQVSVDPLDDDSCEGCGNSFSFFRKRLSCQTCYRCLCEKCLVRPFSPESDTKTARQCVACAYGADFAHRRTGVDPAAVQCMVCTSRFSILKRRHWCRRCGRTICNGCSVNRLSFVSRRHPDCICRRCYVPKIFRLSYDLAHYMMEFVPQAGRKAILCVCHRFRRLLVLPFATVGRIEDYYIFDANQVLGEGTFGIVYDCVSRITQQKCAAKVISKSKMYTYEKARLLQREIEVHSRLSHENTVPLYEVLQTTTDIFMIMGNAGEHDLVEYLVSGGRLAEDQAARITSQLLTFLEYLHSEQHVIHRDLKPDNIVISTTPEILVKVVDFGLAKYVGPPPEGLPATSGPGFDLKAALDEHAAAQKRQSSGTLQTPRQHKAELDPDFQMRLTPCGTLRYCPPEVLWPGGWRSGVYYPLAFKRDVFSLGVIVFVMLVGRLPYTSSHIRELRREMSKPVSFRHPNVPAISSSAQSFIEALCSLHPRDRPSAEEALRHPWLAQHGSHEVSMGPLEVREPLGLRKQHAHEQHLSHDAPVLLHVGLDADGNEFDRSIKIEGGMDLLSVPESDAALIAYSARTDPHMTYGPISREMDLSRPVFCGNSFYV
eukprot:NODE_401_length_2293_cov_32.731764_g372_i0.p1 GENE.NODE_401_length_2293_cov_32.731764_g372_i0~~NODE_401_length_2293_cov_32.731764_g372_i0.p1  ORF type:complete len:716 (+),score=136.01 NODE_401_length_2293_cov_32.731764_g372_i0:85-2148(+)